MTASKPDPKRPWKAIVAGVVTGCGSTGLALTDGHITAAEWLVIVPTTVLSIAGVYGISNPSVPDEG